ncbi:MAG: hypothetical protein L0J43_12705 [Tetragenococcus koreensis]|nr:hypothetical protein [Tetragenococcus koreensis]MDN6256004.1 hypothetical protein [Tetragenococcus koreensis]
MDQKIEQLLDALDSEIKSQGLHGILLVSDGTDLNQHTVGLLGEQVIMVLAIKDFLEKESGLSFDELEKGMVGVKQNRNGWGKQ